MINVSKIKKGIVLDHIECGKGNFIYQTLKLYEVKDPVVLMQNIPSSSLGKKDLIKIETDFDLDFTILGLITPHTTVNFIEDGKRIKKFRMKLPNEIIGVMKCKNPRCITHDEDVKDIKFTLVNSKTKQYRCEYCDSLTTFGE